MTKIEWTHYTAPDGKVVKGFTLNPAKGCSHAAYQPTSGGHKVAHPGCQNCYAEGFCKRNLHGEAATVGRWDGTIETYPERLSWPFTKFKARRDGLPRIGFTHSESDPGHPNYPEDFWMAVQGAMLLSPWIIWKDLTKRPERQRALLEKYSPAQCVDAFCRAKPGGYCVNGKDWLRDGWRNEWGAYRHIHRYVSVSDQATADALIPELLKMSAAVRGVSLEPMVERVDLTQIRCGHNNDPIDVLSGIDWRMELGQPRTIQHVIIGGESGRNARPFDLQWAEDVIEQCKRVGVPVYMKQMGSNPIEGPMILPRPMSGKGGDPSEWPEALRVRQHVGLPEGCF